MNKNKSDLKLNLIERKAAAKMKATKGESGTKIKSNGFELNV